MNSQRALKAILAGLPLHAEEGNVREEIVESSLVANIQTGGNDLIAAEITVAIMRRLFESLALLDPALLMQERWAFVSFPASLMARSVLETLATPGNTFFEQDYWLQGKSRPDKIEEEQRELLRRLENQRISTPNIDPVPIRTVHVTWGIILLGTKFLLHKREDKSRPDVGGYVFPGGRLDTLDLPIENRSPYALRDLFCIDSVMAKNAQERTLVRELREELDLMPSEFTATYQRTLQPFRKVEGARNNHVYTQYNIAVYSVQLSSTGELKVLDQAADKPADWQWFSALELVAGKRFDGKRAFIDALMQEPLVDVEKYLSAGIPDSSRTPPLYRTKSDAIALPSAAGKTLLKGDAGRQKPIQLTLDQDGWELLMLLGWHARGLEINLHEGLMVSLGGGWVKLCGEELLETARRLARQFEAIGLRLIECDPRGHCRLSIDVDHLYFQPDCFEYFWDIESDEKPIVLKLKGIETKWGMLKGKEISCHLSPAILKAMPAIEGGREPEVDPDTIRREFKRLLEPALSMGLHQFITQKNSNHEILVPNIKTTSD